MAASAESIIPTEPFSCEKIHKGDSFNDVLIQFPPLHEAEGAGDEDNDDALSLCDLPIYGGSDSFSSLNDGFNVHVYEEEADSFFEFLSFSGELGAESSCQDAEDNERDPIIFCGKYIACKDAVTKPICEKSSPVPGPVNLKPRRRALFSWRKFKIASFSFRKSKKVEALHRHSSQSSPPSSSMEKKDKGVKARRLEKMPSALLTSPTKSRWYLFMFGQTRFPQAMTMELSDLKSRQRRRCSPSPSMNRHVIGSGAEAEESRRGRGLWSLFKEAAASVSRPPANDVVRAVGSISLA
uniref:Uncharacterized protein n=1 Tax=Kalanchoe fedtschenkoi TaxID=63787 RepID=A0A7N0V5K6_KALFE